MNNQEKFVKEAEDLNLAEQLIKLYPYCKRGEDFCALVENKLIQLLKLNE